MRESPPRVTDSVSLNYKSRITPPLRYVVQNYLCIQSLVQKGGAELRLIDPTANQRGVDLAIC